MIKKKLEDIKLNSRSVKISKSKEETIKKEVSSHTPIVYSDSDELSKYNFLKKKDDKNNKEHSYQRISHTPKLPSNKHHFNKIILHVFILSLIIGTYYLLSTVFDSTFSVI